MGLDPLFGMFKDEASGQWANRDVMEAYWRLKDEARKAGYEIILVSGRRSFTEQRTIWNRKWNAFLKDSNLDDETLVGMIQQYTSVPGLSRHHWGTELDLSEEKARREMRDPLCVKSVRAERFHEWLRENAPRFGFCQPYRGHGVVKPEPWHWTYRRYSSVYEVQMDACVDATRIAGRGVKGEEYLKTHLWSIYREQRRSVDRDCRTK